MNAIINGISITFSEGETILAAARRNGIFVPSLCAFHALDHKPAACRVCLVECTFPQGEKQFVTACSTPMEEGMIIVTDSAEVRARQRKQVELVFADHDLSCESCARRGDCELQDLREQVGLAALTLPARGALRPVDGLTGLVRDMSKCVRCMRCVEVCRSVQGVGALCPDSTGKDEQIILLDRNACVQCGQCTLVCPVGALAERDECGRVFEFLGDPAVRTVFAFAPSVRVVLGEFFGFGPGENVEGRIVAALRRLGAAAVIDTDFAADVVIMEEGTELLGRIKNGGKLPMFTSCCPGWMNFAEQHIPAVLPHISSTRSPQAVSGALCKSYLPEKLGMPASAVRTVSIMPCVAKKDEAARPELARDGVPDTDVVLTVRELARLLRSCGIDLADVQPEPFDDPFMSDSTGAAVIFGTTGGVMEAAVRTVYAVLNGRELPALEVMPVRGEDGLREAEIDLGEGNGVIRVAVCHGLANARKLAEQAVAGQSPYTFIEVMACPGGCVDGGGTCRVKGDYHPHARERQQGLYAIDKDMPRRQSHLNPQVTKLYADLLGEPNSHKAHELLHTHYSDRSANKA